MPHASDSSIKGSYADSKSDALESRPTINLFELWEDGSNLCKLVTGRNYLPECLVVSCAWLQRPKTLSLRDAVYGVAHHSREMTTMDRVAHNLSHFPNQPSHSPGSTESNSLTFWWGATLCPPEMNDISLPENVVIAMRIAAMRELSTNTETAKPTLESILDFNGLKMDPAGESTSRANTQIFNSTHEGAELIPKFMDDDSEDTRARRKMAREQTGMEMPRISKPTRVCTAPFEGGQRVVVPVQIWVCLFLGGRS